MDVPTPDPCQTLERKIVEFSASLTDDELTVLHEVLHLAAEGSPEVEGYRMRQPGGSSSADPCEGGEVTFPNTFNMLGNLHGSMHTRRGGVPRLR